MSKPDYRLCFIGDSFVQGVGDPKCLGWVGRVCAEALQQGHRITHFNLVIRRNTSADIKSRWEQEVIRRVTPASDNRLFFAFGTNDRVIEDGKSRIDYADSLENFHQIIHQASNLYPTLVLGPLPIGQDEIDASIFELNRDYAKIAHQLNVPYLDLSSTLAADSVWLADRQSYDGTHPGDAGYALLAQKIQAWSMWWFATT